MDDEECDRKIARYRAALERRAAKAAWKWQNTCNDIRPDQYVDERPQQLTVNRGYENRRRRR